MLIRHSARGLFYPLLFLLLVQSTVHAGAWTRKKGRVYFKLASLYLNSGKEYNYQGARLHLFQDLEFTYPQAEFTEFSLLGYAEYGLTDRLTLIGTLPLKFLRSQRTEVSGGGLVVNRVAATEAGFADLDINIRVALLQAPVVLSLETGVKLPLRYRNDPLIDRPPLGTGEIDGSGKLLFGVSLHPLPGYVTGGVGYRVRGGTRFHDQLLSELEIGYTRGRILYKIAYEGITSTVAPPDIYGRPVVTPLPGGGGVLPDVLAGDQDIYKISPSLVISIDADWSVQLEALHVFAGKNTLAGTTLLLGLVLQN